MYTDDFDGELYIYDTQDAVGSYSTIIFLSPLEQYKYFINGLEVSLADFKYAANAFLWDDFAPALTFEQSQKDGINIIKMIGAI